MIEVYELNSHVLIDGEIPAVITGINIRPAENDAVRIMYEVTWWDERTRKSEWVEPFEVKAQNARHREVKFKPVA